MILRRRRIAATTVDELTVSYTEDGVELVKELDKAILTKGAWSTVMFKYQDWNAQEQAYGSVKFTIRRYQKRNGQFQLKSKFNISSEDQANKIIEVLKGWL